MRTHASTRPAVRLDTTVCGCGQQLDVRAGQCCPRCGIRLGDALGTSHLLGRPLCDVWS